MNNRMTSIAEAMQYFGLEAEERGEPAHILAQVDRLTIKTMFVRPLNPASMKAWPEQIEFFREQVLTLYYKDDRALIKVPAAYVETFGLRAAVLDALTVESVEKMCERYYKGI